MTCKKRYFAFNFQCSVSKINTILLNSHGILSYEQTITIMSTIDWANLGFGYMKTDFNVRCYYRNGKWGEIEQSDSEYIPLHIAATALHYGQEAFEGLKAFRGKDGQIRIFRLEENALRMQTSSQGILMAEVPVDIFAEAVKKAVRLNERFVPPYGSGAALYIRPLLIGSGPQVGVRPAEEYLFMVFVTPVGPYFKAGFKPTPVMVTREFDRAAPQGTGNIKVGGNYAASLKAGVMAHSLGYSAVLYLDPKEKKYIDECGPANFFGIKDNHYITPASSSILPSITNKSLIQLATDMGLTIERRRVAFEELATFEEAGQCGTAAVISPIERIDDVENGTSFVYSKDGEPGPVSTQLYQKLRAIQYGDVADPYGWITIVD
jgi:branched-chain amino acid aminotransferase